MQRGFIAVTFGNLLLALWWIYWYLQR